MSNFVILFVINNEIQANYNIHHIKFNYDRNTKRDRD